MYWNHQRQGAPHLWARGWLARRLSLVWNNCASQGNIPPPASVVRPFSDEIWWYLGHAVGGPPPQSASTPCKRLPRSHIGGSEHPMQQYKILRTSARRPVCDLHLLKEAQVNVCLRHPTQLHLESAIADVSVVVCPETENLHFFHCLPSPPPYLPCRNPSTLTHAQPIVVSFLAHTFDLNPDFSCLLPPISTVLTRLSLLSHLPRRPTSDFPPPTLPLLYPSPFSVSQAVHIDFRYSLVPRKPGQLAWRIGLPWLIRTGPYFHLFLLSFEIQRWLKQSLILLGKCPHGSVPSHGVNMILFRQISFVLVYSSLRVAMVYLHDLIAKNKEPVVSWMMALALLVEFFFSTSLMMHHRISFCCFSAGSMFYSLCTFSLEVMQEYCLCRYLGIFWSYPLISVQYSPQWPILSSQPGYQKKLEIQYHCMAWVKYQRALICWKRYKA